MSGEEKTKTAAELWLERSKAYFDVAKQLVLGVIVLVVVCYPPAIGNWINGTGVTKGKFFGFEWETKLNNTDAELRQAQADKLNLEGQLKVARTQFEEQSKLLELLKRELSRADADKIASALSATTKIIADTQNVIYTAQQNSASAQRTIAANSNLLTQDRSAGSWVLLVGSDATKEAAQDEVARARSKDYRNVRIIHNKNVYRTGILYSDRKAAFDDLPAAKINLRKDAYVLSMDQFCPNREDKSDVIECGG